MDTMETTTPPAAEDAAGSGLDLRPWPRYFARMLDTFLFSGVVMFIAVIVVSLAYPDSAERWLAHLGGVGGTLVSNIVSPVMAMMPIAMLLAYGQTPGKWLLGIRVRDSAGNRMGLWTSIKREAWVYVRGMGLGLPVINLFTMVMNHGDLKNEGITPWDKALGLHVTHAPATALWWVRATLGAVIVIAAMFWGMVEYFRGIAI